MTYHDAMAYSNKFCKDSIIIVVILIYFNDDLNKLKSYDFNVFFIIITI